MHLAQVRAIMLETVRTLTHLAETQVHVSASAITLAWGQEGRWFRRKTQTVSTPGKTWEASFPAIVNQFCGKVPLTFYSH